MLYDIIERAKELSVKSESSEVRLNCRQVRPPPLCKHWIRSCRYVAPVCLPVGSTFSLLMFLLYYHWSTPALLSLPYVVSMDPFLVPDTLYLLSQCDLFTGGAAVPARLPSKENTKQAPQLLPGQPGVRGGLGTREHVWDDWCHSYLIPPGDLSLHPSPSCHPSPSLCPSPSLHHCPLHRSPLHSPPFPSLPPSLHPSLRPSLHPSLCPSLAIYWHCPDLL